MNKTVKIFAAALALTAALTGCKSSGGGATGGGSVTPYKVYPLFSDSPTAQIDAAPEPTSKTSGLAGYDCSIYIVPSASGLIAGGGQVVANAFGYCKGRPTSVHMTMVIQSLSASIGWVDNPPGFTGYKIPPVFPLTDHYKTSTFCTPGTYHVLITVSGLTGDKPPIPFGPISRAGNQITFSEAQCTQ